MHASPTKRQTFPRQELCCHWITLIPAVSEEAFSCKSTHMSPADSRVERALPAKVKQHPDTVTPPRTPPRRLIFTSRIPCYVGTDEISHFRRSILLTPQSSSQAAFSLFVLFFSPLSSHLHWRLSTVGEKTRARGCAHQAGWQQRCECASPPTHTSYCWQGSMRHSGQTGRAFVHHPVSFKVCLFSLIVFKRILQVSF